MEQIGKYKVLAHIGHGAMGSVEKAEAPDGTIVAIKTLFPQFVYEDEYVRRFKREAELAKKLSHPNVVKIIEIGEDNEGRRQYIVMEFIDGKTLAECMHDKGMASIAIKRSSKLNEKAENEPKELKTPAKTPAITTFSPDETIKIMRQLAGVLQAANDIGLLHRDVKPQNILLDKKGNAKLLDFGLAKDTEALVSMLSMTGQSIGTPPYMSPEQHDGQKDIDIRSDLYSLGCTAYQMLTGKAPFPGPTVTAFARQHCDDIPEPVHKINPDCPLNLSQLIDRLLAKNPKNRHQSPAELIEDLNRVERGEVPLKLYKPRKSKKHNPVRNWLTVATAVIIVAACFLGWNYYRNSNAETIINEAMSDARQMAVKHNFDSAKKVLDSTISEYAVSKPELVKEAESLRTKLIEQQGKWIASEAARKRQEAGTELTRAEVTRKRKLYNCLRNAERLKNQESRVKEAETLINKAYQLCNSDAEREKIAAVEKKVREALTKIRPWAAVADFTLDKSVEAKLTGSAVAVKLEQALGQKYRLVTRNQVNKALKELRFQSSDLADKSKAQKFGKLVGAEYLISGSVIQLGREITVACQIFSIETGAIRQTAEVSAADVNDFNYMIRDAAKILAMPNSEKIKYVEKLNSSKRASGGKYPQIPQDFPDKKIGLYSTLGMEFIHVVPGSFMMGSNKKDSEKPVHKVTISNPYWISKYEVTQKEYQFIMGINPSNFKGMDRPVEQVTWNEAMKFCKKLTVLDHKAGYLPSDQEYRLPTEAEWEFAARGGIKSKGYAYSGSNNLDEVSWYRSTSGTRTHDVGTKKPNELGIHDMLGNVWEMCLDGWTPDYNGAADDAHACNNISAKENAIRGGSCVTNAIGNTITYRAGTPKTRAKGSKGFRIVRVSTANKTVPLKPESVDKIIPGLNIKLVLIKPGSFVMGDNNGAKNEKPEHKVNISNAYWIGKYEVTQKEYQAIMGNNPSYFNKNSDDKPVEQVTWNNAAEFCKKINDQEKKAGRLPDGYEYRLPTEAEWEFAARGGNKSKGYRYSGSNDIDKVAWHYENSGKTTQDVGTKAANELGIYDMCGNVWEWCNDWAGKYKDSICTDPTGPETGNDRINKGGSFGSRIVNCRIADRVPTHPGKIHGRRGFRIALAPCIIDNKIAASTSLERTVSDLGMKLVYVAPGSFMMGTDDEAKSRPVHKVIIENAYWIGKYEVTQKEYQKIMDTNPSHFNTGDDKPVEQVSWNDTRKFCEKLTEQEKKAGRLPSGYEYRLPTESEWEYAARGGNKSKGYIYSGSSNIDSVAWHTYNSDKQTHDVGKKLPNELGIYDMSGNVWEWCLDDWRSNYNNAPENTGKSNSHANRGGSCRNNAKSTHVAYRNESATFRKVCNLGFRVVLAPVIESKTVPEKIIPDLDLKLIYVEPGSFMMGSDKEDNSKPLHKVNINKAYWIGKYEVTQQEYQALMGTNPSHYKKEKRPVEQVSWNDAVKFCHKLTEQEKKAKRLPDDYEYRLPTEAEWEYAARGGNASKGYTYSGSNDAGTVAWNKHTAKKRPHEVGGKAGNELGIHDMSGNVYEWCLDNWHDNYDKAPSDAGVWLNPFNNARVYRGGGFLSPSRWCTTEHRSQNVPEIKIYRLGFRIVLAPVMKTVHAKVPDKIIPDLGMKLVYIAPGSFKMGSNNSMSTEKPAHEVNIYKAYWIGKYEVTQKEYQKIMGTNPSHFRGDNKPVEKVNWHDAMNFCKKLTEREHKAGRLPSGYTYQLPTEAEWEFAARGGNQCKGYRYSGSENFFEVAWTTKNSGKQTHEVGEKSANEIGVHDMNGNVYEWCMDDWHPNYTNAPSSANCWGKGDSPLRVRRGGGWRKDVNSVTHRSCSPPSRKYNYLGFRVVLRTYHEREYKNTVSLISNLPDTPKPSPAPIVPQIKSSPKITTLSIEGEIDGSDEILITAKNATWKHKSWRWPENVKINGIGWNPRKEPVLKNKGNSRYLSEGIDFSNATLSHKTGRGMATFTKVKDGLKIYFVDNTNGSDNYKLVISFPDSQKEIKVYPKIEEKKYKRPSENELKKNIIDEKRIAKKRMYADMRKYSKKENEEIESLYQAMYKLKDTEKTKNLKKLIAKYPKANRSGCAMLYLAYYTEGDAQRIALLKVIRKYSDCYYGDGTNVGACAKLFLARYYLKNHDLDKLKLLFDDLKKNHPTAIHHNRKNIVLLVGDML